MAPIRIVLGVAVVSIAIARGLEPVAAFAAAAVGAVVLTLIAVGQSSRAGLRAQPEAEPVPGDARFDPAWIAALLACVPSTVGVALMAGIALVFSAALGALLAGVLLALGALALAFGLQLALQERAEGVRYWLEHGPRPRRYVSGTRKARLLE